MKVELKENIKMSFFWLVLGTVLMFYSNWNWAVSLATWLFSVFLLRFSRTQKKRIGLPILLVANIIIGIVSMLKLLEIEAIPPSFKVISGVAVGIVFYIPFLADRFLAPKINGFVSTLVFPCSWTSLEYIKSLGNGSWGALAYTQYGNLPFMQLASIIGIWGLAFIITWFASIINFAWERQFSWSKIRKVVSVYGVLIFFVFLYGFSRLATSEESAGKICVGTVISMRDFLSRFYEPDWTERERAYKTMQEDLDYFITETGKSARAGAQIVFWQEYALSVMDENKEEFVDRIKRVAREEQIYLGAAIGQFPINYPDEPWLNKLVWIDPEGQVVDEYIKLKPAPPLEPIVPGEGGISILETAYGKIASVICADLDYPSLVRQAGADGAEILLIPAQNWKSADPLHSEMAVFRAIENGVSVFKGAGGGLSIAVDPYGRVINALDYFTSPQRQLISCLPNKGVTTLYSRFGDIFAWLCIIGFLTLAGWGGLVRKKKTNLFM